MYVFVYIIVILGSFNYVMLFWGFVCVCVCFHSTYTVTYLLVLLVVVRQHLIGSQVLTLCPPLRNVSRVQAVTESRACREIDDVLQIIIKFTLEANNSTRINTSYILGHGIERRIARHLKLL